MSRFLRSLAVTCVLASLTLAACSGGATVPNTLANTGSSTNSSSNNGASIASVLTTLQQPASSTRVDVLSATPGTDTDPNDTSTVVAAPLTAAGIALAASAKIIASHVAPVNGAGLVAPASSKRSAQASALNSPLDLNYFGGPVLGSAVSNPLYVNCPAACRQQQLLFPGKFLSDLGKDVYTTLLYQYLSAPGEQVATPLTGRYVKGAGADISFTPGPAQTVAGFTNPVISVSDLIGIIVQGLTATGGLDLAHNHIYHVFLPPNYDTCMDPANTHCYSPDNPSAFAFCAYHSYLTATLNDGTVVPLYFSVEPDTDTPACRPPTNLPLPNQVGSNRRTDAQDSTLSHELIEAITDPQGTAWVNQVTGSEIGDLCAYFDNFVTINGNKYIIQSEYSDIGQECISANLTNPNVVTAP